MFLEKDTYCGHRDTGLFADWISEARFGTVRWLLRALNRSGKTALGLGIIGFWQRAELLWMSAHKRKEQSREIVRIGEKLLVQGFESFQNLRREIHRS